MYLNFKSIDNIDNSFKTMYKIQIVINFFSTLLFERCPQLYNIYLYYNKKFLLALNYRIVFNNLFHCFGFIILI